MARHVLLSHSQLSEGLILSPERYDPRRQVSFANHRSRNQVHVSDVATLKSSTVNRQTKAEKDIMYVVLDACDAKEGFLIARKRPILQSQIGSSKKILKPGDVIISRLRPYLRQVAYIDEQFFEQFGSEEVEVVGSTEFFVLRAEQGSDIAYLVPFLLSKAVQVALGASQEGGHHPRFNKETLLGLPLPDKIRNQEAAISKDIHDAIRHYRESDMLMSSALLETEAMFC